MLGNVNRSNLKEKLSTYKHSSKQPHAKRENVQSKQSILILPNFTKENSMTSVSQTQDWRASHEYNKIQAHNEKKSIIGPTMEAVMLLLMGHHGP